MRELVKRRDVQEPAGGAAGLPAWSRRRKSGMPAAAPGAIMNSHGKHQ
jgi:hypothetical protein